MFFLLLVATLSIKAINSDVKGKIGHKVSLGCIADKDQVNIKWFDGSGYFNGTLKNVSSNLTEGVISELILNQDAERILFNYSCNIKLPTKLECIKKYQCMTSSNHSNLPIEMATINVVFIIGKIFKMFYKTFLVFEIKTVTTSYMVKFQI